MILSNPSFEIDVAEQRSRPLVLARMIQSSHLRAETYIAIPVTRDFFQQPALMFAVKGFEQASVFWFSPGAVLLDDVHGRGQS